MAQFEVSGVDRNGKNVKMMVEGDSPKSARTKARSMGITPVSVEMASAARVNSGGGGALKQAFTSSLRGVSTEELADMTRQLATLVKAHVPIVESLSALVEQIESPKLKGVLSTVRTQVNEGNSLGDGFAQFPKIFNRVYINMVKAGESSGRLDVVLLQIADFTEGQVKLRNKVQQALLYPVIMTTIGFLVVLAILIFVVPQITRIFTDMKRALPLPTIVLIAVSDFLKNYYWGIIIGSLGIGLLFERYLATSAGRAWKDAFLLKRMVIGKILRNLAVSRFSRTLGTLLSSGVPMINALEITHNVVNNTVFENTVNSAKEMVSEGRTLNHALKQSGEFPPIVIHMVSVGEKTGELEPMLLNVAENYERQVENNLSSLTGLLEPLLIVVMAGLVSFIVMAVLLPILEMNQFAS